ncbi:hypothetical protein HY061_02600, partial [Candidatus Azambacteria bacterium]|nr:hypothetical protein [Candidatus Azambacteria bacterium]
MKFIFSKKPNQEVTKVIFTKKEENQVLIAADINQVEIKPGQKIISLGLGEIEKFNLRKFILLGRKIIVLAKANKIKKIIID